MRPMRVCPLELQSRNASGSALETMLPADGNSGICSRPRKKIYCRPCRSSRSQSSRRSSGARTDCCCCTDGRRRSATTRRRRLSKILEIVKGSRTRKHQHENRTQNRVSPPPMSKKIIDLSIYAWIASEGRAFSFLFAEGAKLSDVPLGVQQPTPLALPSATLHFHGPLAFPRFSTHA